LQLDSAWMWGAATVFWCVGSALLLSGGASLWVRVPVEAKWLVGVVGLGVAWLAVNQARVVGINFLLSTLALVWVADIAAYFSGRSFGGKVFSRKLAPSISPGKTWEGAIGGMIGVLALAALWRELDASFQMSEASLFTRLGTFGQSYFIGALLLLGVMSVVGDLVESLFKRAAGVKDSSGLLPGHGGVLDRIDALLPVLPIAMYLANA
jgi:phosphatidate cytidylyltransferase